MYAIKRLVFYCRPKTGVQRISSKHRFTLQPLYIGIQINNLVPHNLVPQNLVPKWCGISISSTYYEVIDNGIFEHLGTRY